MKFAKFTSAINGSLFYLNPEKIICIDLAIINNKEVTCIDCGGDDCYHVKESVECCIAIIRAAQDSE